MRIIPRPELEKMSTERLLNIRRHLTPAIMSSRHDDVELEELLAFDKDLREIMAKRPHVPR